MPAAKTITRTKLNDDDDDNDDGNCFVFRVISTPSAALVPPVSGGQFSKPKRSAPLNSKQIFSFNPLINYNSENLCAIERFIRVIRGRYWTGKV